MLSSSGISKFTHTCSLLQSALPNIPATASGLVSGVFIYKATSINGFGGINLLASGASHIMGGCRLYYPQVQLKPQQLVNYITDNGAKKSRIL